MHFLLQSVELIAIGAIQKAAVSFAGRSVGPSLATSTRASCFCGLAQFVRASSLPPACCQAASALIEQLAINPRHIHTALGRIGGNRGLQQRIDLPLALAIGPLAKRSITVGASSANCSSFSASNSCHKPHTACSFVCDPLSQVFAPAFNKRLAQVLGIERKERKLFEQAVLVTSCDPSRDNRPSAGGLCRSLRDAWPQ